MSREVVLSNGGPFPPGAAPKTLTMINKAVHISVAEVMSRDLYVVRPEDTLERVYEIFHAKSIHHIPVVNEKGKLCGIVSKSDFLRVNHMFCLFNKEKYEEYNQKLYKAMQVQEIMTSHVATLSPADPLTVAAGIFAENLFHALPVVDKGSLVGILTTQDLLGYCFSEQFLLD